MPMAEDSSSSPRPTNSTSKQKNNSQIERIDFHTCSICIESLPRSSFSKKTFQKNILHCHTCRKSITALRSKQPLPKPKKTHARRAPSGLLRRPNNFGYCTYLDKLFSLSCFADIVSLGVFKTAKDVSESMAVLGGAFRHGNVYQQDYNTENGNVEAAMGRLKHDPTLETDLFGNDVALIQTTELIHSTTLSPSVLCLCIGDGTTPQTAVLASFLKKNWMCVSIDPALREEWRGNEPQGVRNLFGFRGTLQEFVNKNSSTSASTVGNRDDQDVEDGFRKAESHPMAFCDQSFRHLVLLCVHSHARFLKSCSIPNIRIMFGRIPTTLVSLPCCTRFRHVGDIGVEPDMKYEDDCVFSDCRNVEIWNFKGQEQMEFLCQEVGTD